MNHKIIDKLNEEKFQHLDRVHDLYFELEPDLEYDEECTHSHSDGHEEEDTKGNSYIQSGNFQNTESPRYAPTAQENSVKGNAGGQMKIHTGNHNHEEEYLLTPESQGFSPQKLDSDRDKLLNELNQHQQLFDLTYQQKFVTADPNQIENQQPLPQNQDLASLAHTQQNKKSKLHPKMEEPIFYSTSPRQNVLEKQLHQELQPNPYELMKLIESARQSPNAKQQLQDTKDKIQIQKKLEASQMKKKPQLTANENLILGNFKEKLIEQMEQDRAITNKTHFSKKQRFKHGRYKDTNKSHDTVRSGTKKKEKDTERGTGTGTGITTIDHDLQGSGPIHATFDSHRSNKSDNAEVLAMYKQNKINLGAGFGIEGPSNEIKRKELLVDKIMKEKMLKKGLSKYDPNMMTKMDTISNKMQVEIRKVNKKASNKLRSKTLDSPELPDMHRELTKLEKEQQKEKRRTFLNFFSSLTKGNLQGTRKAMKRKCDELHDTNKTKQAKLDSLYLELGQLAFVNLEDQICQKSDRKSPQKLGGELYQGKPTDTIYDTQSTQRVFDYSNLKTILQHREVLQQKLELSQRRLRETETEGETYNQILLSLKHREIDDQKAQAKTIEKERDIAQIVEDVHMVKKLEEDRKYNFRVLQTKYKKKLVSDHHKMNKILDEKQEIESQLDIETQHILHNLLQRVREIKSLNKSLKQLDQAKIHLDSEEVKIMEVFSKRQEEFSVLKILQQLNKLRVYQEKIDIVMKKDLTQELEEEEQQDRSFQIDFIRIEGLKLVDQLKGSISDIQRRDQVSKQTRASEGVSKKNASSVSGNFSSKRNSLNSPSSLKKKSFLSGQDSTMTMISEDAEEFNYENYVFQRVQYETMLQMDQSLLNLDASGIIKTFQQSNITINSLRNAFKQSENDKIEKQKIVNKLVQERQFLENEAEHVQKFIQQLTQITYSNDAAGIEESINLNLKGEMLKYPLSPEGMNFYLDKINVKSKGIYNFHSVQVSQLREFISGLKFFMQLTLKKVLIMHKQGQNCIEFDDKDTSEIQVMNSKYNQKKRRKKNTGNNTAELQSPKNSSALDFQRSQLKSRGTSFISRFSKFDATQSRQSPTSQINSQQDSVESKKTEESTQEQQDQMMIDQDLPSLVNILLKSQQNGFKIDGQFRKRRDSCSHSQSSARSKQAANVQLDISEFDPIFRRSDFKQVRRNVHQELLGEYARVVGTKQWEVLRQQGIDRVSNVYTTIIQDNSQKEFLKLGTKIKKEKQRARLAEEERLRALEVKRDDDDDEFDSKDSLDLNKPKKKDMDKERKEAADRLARLKLLDKNENMIIKNKLYRQKHKVQEVQRSEKYFIEDLKHKLSERYQTMRDQFDSIYDSEAAQRSTQNHSMTIRDWDLSQGSLGAFATTSKRGKANLSVVQDSIHVSPIKMTNYMERESLVERQSKTGTGNRPVCVRKNGNVVANMSLQKRNLKQYNDYVNRAHDETEEFLNQKFHTLDKKLVYPQNEYSSVDPLDSFKPLRSVCFELNSGRTPATASIKQRIKISKQMTDSLRPESISSDNPQQNVNKKYRKFNNSVNEFDKFMKQTPYTAHSTFRGNNDLKNINKFAKVPKQMRSHRLNQSLDQPIKKLAQPNYLNLPNSPIYKGPLHAYDAQGRYQDHLFKKYVLRKSQAIEKDDTPENQLSSDANFGWPKPQTAAVQPRKKNQLSMKMASPTKIYNKNRNKEHINFDLKHVSLRPISKDKGDQLLIGQANLPFDLKQSQRQISPNQRNRGLNSTNYNSKSIDSDESPVRIY